MTRGTGPDIHHPFRHRLRAGGSTDEGVDAGVLADDTDAPSGVPRRTSPRGYGDGLSGTVHFEGTQLQKGGNHQPFELIGAPYIVPEHYASSSIQLVWPVSIFAVAFFNLRSKACQCQLVASIHVTNRESSNL